MPLFDTHGAKSFKTIGRNTKLFSRSHNCADHSVAIAIRDTYLEGHIYCESAGDYYAITGGAYRKDEW